MSEKDSTMSREVEALASALGKLEAPDESESADLVDRWLRTLPE